MHLLPLITDAYHHEVVMSRILRTSPATSQVPLMIISQHSRLFGIWFGEHVSLEWMLSQQTHKVLFCHEFANFWVIRLKDVKSCFALKRLSYVFPLCLLYMKYHLVHCNFILIMWFMAQWSSGININILLISLLRIKICDNRWERPRYNHIIISFDRGTCYWFLCFFN